MSAATHWAVGDVEMTSSDEDSAIEQFLDGHDVPLPEKITLDGYEAMELPEARALNLVESHIDLMFDNLAEEFSWEDLNADWKPTEKIKTAMQALAKAIAEDYPVQLMESVAGSSYEVDVRDWVAKERPDWLTERPGLFGNPTSWQPVEPEEVKVGEQVRWSMGGSEGSGVVTDDPYLENGTWVLCTDNGKLFGAGSSTLEVEREC